MEENEFRMMAGHLLAAIARMDQRDQRLEQQLPAIMEEQTARWLKTLSGQVETVTRAGLGRRWRIASTTCMAWWRRPTRP
jgi:hypothetical protein